MTNDVNYGALNDGSGYLILVIDARIARCTFNITRILVSLDGEFILGCEPDSDDKNALNFSASTFPLLYTTSASFKDDVRYHLSKKIICGAPDISCSDVEIYINCNDDPYQLLHMTPTDTVRNDICMANLRAQEAVSIIVDAVQRYSRKVFEKILDNRSLLPDDNITSDINILFGDSKDIYYADSSYKLSINWDKGFMMAYGPDDEIYGSRSLTEHYGRNDSILSKIISTSNPTVENMALRNNYFHMTVCYDDGSDNGMIKLSHMYISTNGNIEIDHNINMSSAPLFGTLDRYKATMICIICSKIEDLGSDLIFEIARDKGLV